MDADAAVAPIKSGPNPFVSNRMDSASDPDWIDVEAINRTAFERCRHTMELVRSTQHCRGLLLCGEPGSGKTHLLQRLRQHVQLSNQDCFVYVPPVSGPERFFRDVLQCAVHDFVAPRSSHPLSQLEDLLVRQLVRAETRERLTAAAFWSDIRKRYPPGEALFSWLDGPMQKLCIQLQLDPEVMRVLQHYLAEHRRLDAYAWLLGRSVSEATVERLGVGRTLEEDADALQAFRTLSRLAGAQSVLVLAFDQLESLQIDPQDQQGLRAFATGVTKVFVECRNVAAISCSQTYFRQDLERAVPLAHMQRLAQDQGALTLLDRGSAIDLVAKRLTTVSEFHELRSALGEREPLWPLQRVAVEKLVDAGGIPARRLLNECRELFEQWRHGTDAVVLESESLDDIWDARVERAAAEPPDEGVLADGVSRLINVRGVARSKAVAGVKDVDLVVSSAEGDVGVAVCHAENMTSLAGRLKRLRTLSEAGRFKRLVIVRDARLAVGPNARATRDHLQALDAAGHAVLRPSAEAYAAIAAARALLADAAAGDLALNGKNVAADDLKAWLAGKVVAATELLSELEGEAQSTQSAETLERIQSLLEGRWVVRAADVASHMQCEEQMLLGWLTNEQRVIGILTGPPVVVFLRPEGLRRD